MDHPPPRMAIDCQWLRRTIDSSRRSNPFLTLCMHIIREDQDCTGPFLEDMETDCRLWDPNQRATERMARTSQVPKPFTGPPRPTPQPERRGRRGYGGSGGGGGFGAGQYSDRRYGLD